MPSKFEMQNVGIRYFLEMYNLLNFFLEATLLIPSKWKRLSLQLQDPKFIFSKYT
jgi:hypothetical protein